MLQARKLQEDVKAANEQVSTLQEALQTSQGRMQEWQQVAIESRIERAAVLEQLYVMQVALPERMLAASLVAENWQA